MKVKVEDYRLQNFDVVKFKNNIIALYYGYVFITSSENAHCIKNIVGLETMHTAFNKPKYTGNHKIDDLKVTKVKHHRNGIVDMESVLNSFYHHDIKWDIEFK